MSVYVNFGFKVLLRRSFLFFIVLVRRFFSLRDKVNDLKWAKVKDAYKGDRLFILGNGPSLNDMPLNLLKNEYTMCFNRFNLMFDRIDWRPTFFAICDDSILPDMINEINSEILPQVKMAFFPDLHPSNINFKKQIVNAENVYWVHTDVAGYRDDLPNCGVEGTVITLALQVAAFLGFKEIYLLGVDLSYSFTSKDVKLLNSRNWESLGPDPNHFDSRYYEKGRKYNNPSVNIMIEALEKGKKFFDQRKVSIFNVGIGGNLHVFPRKNFEEVLLKTEKGIM